MDGSKGPDDRPITDPNSVVSTSNAAARPAPIDDLYYTRSVFGAAWSPDGQQVAAVDFLKATGYVQWIRAGWGRCRITGGSYGGFMTLMAIGKTPDIWDAAVEEYGIISWLTMLKSSDPSLTEYLKALLGNPDTNRKIRGGHRAPGRQLTEGTLYYARLKQLRSVSRTSPSESVLMQ